MTGNYTRDKVRITPVVKDIEIGGVTRGTPFITQALVENESNLVNKDGVELKSDIYIFLSPETNINTDYYIEVIEQFGKTVLNPKERVVIQATPFGNYYQTHWEVYA